MRVNFQDVFSVEAATMRITSSIDRRSARAQRASNRSQLKTQEGEPVPTRAVDKVSTKSLKKKTTTDKKKANKKQKQKSKFFLSSKIRVKTLTRKQRIALASALMRPDSPKSDYHFNHHMIEKEAQQQRRLSQKLLESAASEATSFFSLKNSLELCFAKDELRADLRMEPNPVTSFPPNNLFMQELVHVKKSSFELFDLKNHECMQTAAV